MLIDWAEFLSNWLFYRAYETMLFLELLIVAIKNQKKERIDTKSSNAVFVAFSDLSFELGTYVSQLIGFGRRDD